MLTSKRCLVIAIALLAGCSSDDVATCLTNSECEPGICVNGACAERADAGRRGDTDGGGDANVALDADAADSGMNADATITDAMSPDVTRGDVGVDAIQDPRCGTACPLDSCTSGIWDCDGTEIRCEAFTTLPNGTPCEDPVETEYGPCTASTPCAESGVQTRSVTVSTCQEGLCVMETTDEARMCSRVTRGDRCGGPPSCGSFTCVYPTTGDAYCSGRGRQERRCEVPECRAGLCQPRVYTDFGSSCGAAQFREGDQCGPGDACCRDQTCQSGVCFL